MEQTRDKGKNTKRSFARESHPTYSGEVHSHIRIVRVLSPPLERPKRHGRNRKESPPKINFLLNLDNTLVEDELGKPTFAEVVKVVEAPKIEEEEKPLVGSPDMFDTSQPRWTMSGPAAGSLRRRGTDSSTSTSNTANQPKLQPYIFAPKKTLEARSQLKTISSNDSMAHEATNNLWETQVGSFHPAFNLNGQQNAFRQNPHTYSQYVNDFNSTKNIEEAGENRGQSYQTLKGAQLLHSPEIPQNAEKKDLKGQCNIEGPMNNMARSVYNQSESPVTQIRNNDEIGTIKPQTLYTQTPFKLDYIPPEISHLRSTGHRGGISAPSTEEDFTVFGLTPGGPTRQKQEHSNEKIMQMREETEELNCHMRKLCRRNSFLHRLPALGLSGVNRDGEFEAALDEKMRTLYVAQNNYGLPSIDGAGGFGHLTIANLREQGFAQVFPTCISLRPPLSIYQNVNHLSDTAYYAELNKFHAGNALINIPVLNTYAKMGMTGPGGAANPSTFPYPLDTHTPVSDAVFEGITNRLSYLHKNSGSGWHEVSGLSQYAPMKEVEKEHEGMRRRMGLVLVNPARKQHHPILAGPRGRALVSPPESPTPVGRKTTRYPPGLAPRPPPPPGFEPQGSVKHRANFLPAVPLPRLFAHFQQKKRAEPENGNQAREKHYLGGPGYHV